MIYIVITILALLLAANYTVSRNILYPPSLYTAVWLISLIGVALSGGTLYPVSAEALMVYLVGAVAFSVGGVVVLGCNVKTTQVPFSQGRRARVRRLLDIMLFIVLLALPLYIHDAISKVDASGWLIFVELRRAELEAAGSSERVFSLLRNLLMVSHLVAMAMHYENDGTAARRRRSYVAIAAAFIYGMFTGSKGPILLLILSLMFISFIRAGRVRLTTLASVTVLVLLLFAGGLLLINYAGVEGVMSAETLRLAAETIQLYWLGGLVAFNQVVQMPESLESTQHLSRFFLETANGLGARFPIPPLHAQDSPVSDWQEINTYTIYFSYFKDHGWLGVLIGLSMLGAMLSWVYRRALGGRPIEVMLYASLATGVVFSFNGEHFILNLNFYIKLLIFFYLSYYVLARLSVRRTGYREQRAHGG